MLPSAGIVAMRIRSHLRIGFELIEHLSNYLGRDDFAAAILAISAIPAMIWYESVDIKG